MDNRPNKTLVFVIEGLNSLALAFYFLFLFFFMQQRFGFDNLENLLLGAGGGFVYMAASFICGRVAPRVGYYNCLTAAFIVMPIILLIGSRLQSLGGHLVVFVVSVICMGFVWAPLQTLACMGEPSHRVQRMVGIYNVVWASVVATGFFVAGAMFEAWPESIFVVTAGIMTLQLILTIVMRIRGVSAERDTQAQVTSDVPEERTIAPNIGRAFLLMAWVANPFAFVAANVCSPTIPTIADRLGLSPTYAGVFCSVWLFARAAGFALCWKWKGWHYRLHWLLIGYLAMVISFVAILAIPNLIVLLISQVFFGLSLGLLYYSSLYYSMHVGVEEQGKHGGIHEASIGAGNCAGPLFGAAALHFVPTNPNAGVLAVSAALALGFLWVVRIWSRR